MESADLKAKVSEEPEKEVSEKVAIDETIKTTEDENEVETPEYIELPLGEKLNASACRSVTCAYPTKSIVFAGAPDSGKTTLMASIYESFLNNTFDNFKFKGSKTLIDLEQICYENRISSGRSSSDTPRDQITDQFLYYHLSVVNENHPDTRLKRQELLFSALSGEIYYNKKNNNDAISVLEECKKLTFIKRADVLVIFIDGEKISRKDDRTIASKVPELLLQRMLEAHNAAKNVVFPD